MKEKESVSLISMSDGGNRAEIVIKTERADGKFRSVTRHIRKRFDGSWLGISSSDEVVRNHAAAGKSYNAAQEVLNDAKNALKNAEKAHQKAFAIAAKDPSEKARAKANIATSGLEKARVAFRDATKAVEEAVVAKEALEKKTPLVVGYSI